MQLCRAFSGAPWESKVDYCRALRAGDHIYVTNTARVAEGGGVFTPGDAYTRAQRCFEIIERALRDLGADWACVARTRIFVTEIARWAEFGRAHQDSCGSAAGEFSDPFPLPRKFLGAHPPATTMVGVRALIDPAMLIEVEADAVCMS